MNESNSNPANSRSITTNQTGLNEKLDEVVLRHLNAEFKKPISEHTQIAFDEINAKVKAFGGDIILDSCCGVGESTANIAKLHPDALIIGIDKSAHRLEKHDVEYKQTEEGQYILARADLNDFWRLAVEQNGILVTIICYIQTLGLKRKHLQRRWHGAAVFPYIIQLGGKLELRSNWKTYVDEFARALELAKLKTQVELYQSDESITPFERKYWASGQK